MEQKKVVILGGGTISHVRAHLALSAVAYGTTAKTLADLCEAHSDKLEIELDLTKMACSGGATGRGIMMETNADVKKLVEDLITDLSVKIIFFNIAMTDFEGQIGNIKSGKYAERLKTKDFFIESIKLSPSEKIISNIRKERKDIFLIGFKTTSDASEQDQYLAGLNLLKKSSCNIVLANDLVTRKNMIITPEESKYSITNDRNKALKELVEIAYLRSHLSFTRSTVVKGDLVPWNSNEVFSSLRTIVNYCISKNAYKPFNGATVGHFACKIGEKTFLTSIRKSNFNDIEKNGLVKVETDGPDTVIAYGAKPSVGGQSQRIVFSEHNDYDCIVHFHCPIKETSEVPIISQKEYECGSHECGQNTSKGLQKFGNLSAVMLDNHGPNIVFHHSINPQEVIDFIENNFDLSNKTGGLVEIKKERKILPHEFLYAPGSTNQLDDKL